MATPHRPMAARPWRASLGKTLSRSQRAAFGASCSAAKRRTASRISSVCADIGERVMAEEVALLAMTLGHAVDAPAAHLQDSGGAVHVLALGGSEEGGIELGGEGIALNADPRLDGEPHRAIGRC